jgi:tyrosine-protein phosphatase non-receptor type 12/18/22
MNAADVLGMLQHVRHLREAADGGSSSLLVHCSAGVGRTGTFIVIDHVMNAIKERRNVDIIQIIEEIREDRMALVQHVAQVCMRSCTPPYCAWRVCRICH